MAGIRSEIMPGKALRGESFKSLEEPWQSMELKIIMSMGKFDYLNVNSKCQAAMAGFPDDCAFNKESSVCNAFRTAVYLYPEQLERVAADSDRLGFMFFPMISIGCAFNIMYIICLFSLVCPKYRT
jgi:hypothetical protein